METLGIDTSLCRRHPIFPVTVYLFLPHFALSFPQFYPNSRVHSKITVSACGRIVFAFYFRYTKRYGIETETFDVEESELISMNQKYFDYLREEAPEAAAILQSKSFRSLLHYPRHIYTNTYDHSVRVAICMAWLAKRGGTDPASAVKVGLLPGLYCFYHPEEAADNANREFGLSRREEKAIRAHMFPLSVHLPSSKLAFHLLLADKAVAVYELTLGVRFLRTRLSRLASKRILRKV